MKKTKAGNGLKKMEGRREENHPLSRIGSQKEKGTQCSLQGGNPHIESIGKIGSRPKKKKLFGGENALGQSGLHQQSWGGQQKDLLELPICLARKQDRCRAFFSTEKKGKIGKKSYKPIEEDTILLEGLEGRNAKFRGRFQKNGKRKGGSVQGGGDRITEQ